MNHSKLNEIIYSFYEFAKNKDIERGYISDKISFTNSASWLYYEEGYKQILSIKAREALSAGLWNKSSIGQGNIIKCVQSALKCPNNNLVDWRMISKFENKCSQTDLSLLENVFYSLYRENNDKECFEQFTQIFGKNYDLIAFLFFIKNPEQYLPIHTKQFDKAFRKVGINFITTRQCSWNNYNKFIKHIKEIQHILNELDITDTPPSLIDAHSFLWVVSNEDYQIKVKSYKEAEAVTITTTKQKRSSSAREEAIRLHGTKCYVCNFDFEEAYGELGKGYIEVHHKIPLANQEGIVETNAERDLVCLCANCHRMVHRQGTIDVDELKKIYQDKH